MKYGIDTDAYNKPGTNFAGAVGQGFTNNYIKMGGGNLSGNAPYLITSNGGYHGFVAKNRAASAERTGHYWITGGNPTTAAQFVLRNLDWRDGDFFVIDNEKLDYGRVWSDAECMAFWNVLWSDSARGASIKKNSFHYGSQVGLYGAMSFPRQWAAGVKAIIALYNGEKSLPSAHGVPALNVKGHQYSSSATLNGTAGVLDVNVFSDDAFATGSGQAAEIVKEPTALIGTEEDEMYLRHYQNDVSGKTGGWYVIGPSGIRAKVKSASDLDLIKRFLHNEEGTKPPDSMLPAEWNIIAAYQKAVYPAPAAPTVTSTATIDDAKLTAAVDAAVSKALKNVTVTLS